jgi:hypothetical protein
MMKEVEYLVKRFANPCDAERNFPGTFKNLSFFVGLAALARIRHNSPFPGERRGCLWSLCDHL